MPKISKREKGIPKTTLEKSAPNPIDGDPMIGWLQDLEKIFEKAMEEEMKKNALIDAAMAEEKKAEEEAIDPLEFAPEVDILV